jgi:hypothetical protein
VNNALSSLYKLLSKGYIFGFFFVTLFNTVSSASESTVSEDARIEPRTVATTALAVRRSNHSVRSHTHP